MNETDDYPVRPPRIRDERGLLIDGELPPPPAPDPDDPDLEASPDELVDLLDQHAATENAERDAAAEVEQARLARIAADPRARAAALVGMRPDEVARVRRKRAGLVVTDRAGVELILVAPDKPDAEGRSGLMLWRRPPRYRGPTPTYAKRACADRDLCPHRPWAPRPDQVAAIRAQRAAAEAAVKAAEAAAKVEHERGREPWAQGERGNMYRELLAREADLDRIIESRGGLDGRHLCEYEWQEREAVQKLIKRTAARLQAQWEDEHPPPPDPRDVARHTAIAEWAARLGPLERSGAPDRVLRAEHERITANSRYTAHLYPEAEVIRREGTASRKWLEARGIPVPTLDEVDL